MSTPPHATSSSYLFLTLWLQSPGTNFRQPFTHETWGTTIDECDWYGVFFLRQYDWLGDFALTLGEIGVQGQISADLALLTALVVLDLTSARQVGSISPSVGVLTSHVVLQKTLLTGTIPSSFGALKFFVA